MLVSLLFLYNKTIKLKADQMISVLRRVLVNAGMRQQKSVTIFYYKFPVCWINIYKSGYQLILKVENDPAGRRKLLQWESAAMDEATMWEIHCRLNEIRDLNNRQVNKQNPVFVAALGPGQNIKTPNSLILGDRDKLVSGNF